MKSFLEYVLLQTVLISCLSEAAVFIVTCWTNWSN